MNKERNKTIEAVRARASELAATCPIQELAQVKAYRNFEVCALLDEIDELKNMLAEKLPTSYGRLNWACGHKGPAVCQECAQEWRAERDELRGIVDRTEFRDKLQAQAKAGL